jgi:hypothetical protein
MIIPYQKEFVNQVCSIADLTLGKHYFGEDEIEDLLSFENLALLDVENNIVRAFSFSIITTLKKLENDFKIPPPLLFNDENIRVALTKTIATHPEQQGKGIANNLFEEEQAVLIGLGVKACFTLTWLVKGKINLSSLLKKNNYLLYTVIENYWLDDSIKRKYSCPECGNPCYCNAEIYYKVFNADSNYPLPK